MTSDLPVLVVHGAIVWKVLLAIAVGIALPCAVRARRSLLRRSARSKARSRLRDVEPRGFGWKTLAGTLRGGSVTSVRQAFTFAPKSVRNDRLWLEHPDGGRTELAGAIEVEVGASERAMWWSARDVAVPEARARWTSTIERTVRDGDDVVVRGMVKNADGGWRIGGPTGVPLAIRAAKPAPAVYPLGPVRGAVLVATLVFVSYSVLEGIGSAALKAAERAEPSAETSTLTRIDSHLALAAAMPGSRAGALQLLRRELEFDFEHTDATLALTVAFDHIEGTCAARDLDRAGTTEAALAAAKRCGDRELARQLAARLGRYDEAAADLDPADHGYLATTIAIARGDWKSAALGEELQPCVAAMFRAFAGEPHAFDGLDRSSVGVAVDREQCALQEALTLPREERTRALAAVEPADDDTRRLLEDIRFVFDPSAVEAFELATTDLTDLHGAQWLYRFAPPERFTSVGGGTALAGTALFDLVRGDFAAARQHIEQSARRDDRRDTALEATFALREGSVTMPSGDRDDQPWRSLRRGVALGPNVSLAVLPHTCPLGAAYNAATRSGDGGPLVTVLHQCDIQWDRETNNLLAVLPRVTSHRAELARALRLHYELLRNDDLRTIPFRATRDAADRRDLARLAGDPEAAGMWQQVVARNDAVLADERKLFAFLFWANP